MKKIIYTILLFLMIVVISGCKQKIEIIGPDEVVINETIFLHVDGVKDEEEVTWSSSDDFCLFVENGAVTGLEIGSAVVTAKVGNKTATKRIKVIYPTINITIESKSTLIVGEKYRFFANIPEEYQDLDEGKWSSENEDIISIDHNGISLPKEAGKTNIVYEYYGNIVKTPVEIIYKEANGVALSGLDNVSVNKELQLETIFYPSNSKAECLYFSSDETIATVDKNGLVKGVSVGEVVITVKFKDDLSITATKKITVCLNPSEIKMDIPEANNNFIKKGKIYSVNLYIDGTKFDEEIHKDLLIISVSNKNVVALNEKKIIGLAEGTVDIIIKSSLDNNVSIKKTINVSGNYVSQEGYTTEDYARVDSILSNMSLKQKVGQMFVVGFNGTTFNNTLKDAIKNYNFGNVIYMGANVTDPSSLPQLSKNIQEYMTLNNSVPAIICTDQEGGRVARLKNGATHFISNMGIAATQDSSYANKQGAAMATELLYYGINMDLAPVLDVNNNHDNPVIGVRSYSDNPLMVAEYGMELINGLQNNGVIACSKHFPGHGNTNVDSHYGLPIIDSNLDSLYQVELTPFIHSINGGIDCIMTTHIIFNAIDKEYPATLSEKVITGLLRSELNYNGLIATDGMEMNAVSKNFGDYDETAVLAVKAGVDLLLYTTTTNPITAYNGIMKAINNGEITEERIDQSVRRILLTKLKYNILDQNYKIVDDLLNILKNHEELNIEIACKSLTVAKGEYVPFDKNKRTIIIAPSSTGLGFYVQSYLHKNQFINCDIFEISTPVSSSELNTLNYLLENNNYEQIIYANTNVTANNTNAIKLVDSISKVNANSIIVALDSPYDYLKYNGENINTYICLYGYQDVTKLSLAKLLNNEFQPSGKLPIDENVFK